MVGIHVYNVSCDLIPIKFTNGKRDSKSISYPCLGSLHDPIDLVWVLSVSTASLCNEGLGDDVLATPTVNYQVSHLLVDGATSLEDVVSLHLLLLPRC
jgi:hypothetical protein